MTGIFLTVMFAAGAVVLVLVAFDKSHSKGKRFSFFLGGCFLAFMAFSLPEKSVQKTSLPATTQTTELSDEQRFIMAKTCKLLIKDSAKFSSKADFKWGTESTRKMDGFYRLNGTVELMNGLGAMLPHRYKCDIKDSGDIVDFAIIQGD